MLAGCGIGRDHGQMWRNDAIMHVKCGQYMVLSEMWRYVVRNMKWGAVRDVV